MEFRSYFCVPENGSWWEAKRHMKKWAYPLLIAFVAFFIFTNPGRAGVQGRAFVIWVGDMAGAVSEFMEGLFDDDNDPVADPSTGSGGTSTGGDSFDTMAPLGGST